MPTSPLHIVDSSPTEPVLHHMRDHITRAAEDFDAAEASCFLCERAPYTRCGIFRPHKPADYGGSLWYDRYIIYPMCMPCSMKPTKDALDAKIRKTLEPRKEDV